MNTRSSDTFDGLIALYHGQDQPMEMQSVTWQQPQGGEALIQITHSAICRSDVHTMCGRRHVKTPTVLGHEMIGRIAAVGNDFPTKDLTGEKIAVGDRVTWALYAHCGQCFYCKKGLPQKCEHLFKYGHEPVSKTGEDSSGGMASYIMLHPGTPILKLPDSISDSVATPINCAVSTAAALLRESGVPLDSSSVITVMGGGYAGLSAVVLAKRQGCGRVIVFEPNRDLHQRCLDFGADAVYTPNDDTAVQSIQGWSDDRGVDLALELAGSTDAANMALESLRLGGTLMLAGTVFPSPPIKIDPDQIVRRCLTIKGLHNYRPEDLVEAARCVIETQDTVPWSKLFGGEFRLDDCESAVAFAKDNPGLRAVLYT